ncbi:hypothetical protein WMY93_032717 [Mugilogobius chulae]|uniref:DOT1 domain-containing protein n=1 Tax=Mugilogobius chulae TaxID=88201 RepID=A0AAW0MMT2_9GOBI
MDFSEAKRELLKLLKRTRPEHVGNVLQWVTRSEEVGSLLRDNRSVILENISEELRSLLPQDAMFPSESFCRRQMEACARRTVHVDGFLFDENLLDSMCEDGTFSRNFCLQCGSSRTRELEFLSHSFSVPELRFLFLNVLPDLSGLVLVDVGSRLGAVLYAGHIFSSAQSLIGVELNQDFVKLQNQIVHKCWKFLVQKFRRKGSLLVSVPGLDQSFRQIQETLPSDWLEELPVNYDLFLTSDTDQNEAFRQIHLYRVM